MSIDTEVLNLQNKEALTNVRSKFVINIFSKGLFVTDQTENIPEEGVSETDGMIMFEGLWRTDWALELYEDFVDNIDLYAMADLARCEALSNPGSPLNWDDWESGYNENEPFIQWVAAMALCNQLFYCTLKCFCCQTYTCLSVQCNKTIIKLHYIGFYPEASREDILAEPATAVLMCPKGYGKDLHDEPKGEVTSGDVNWCKKNTVTEKRNEIALNVLMEGEDLYDSQGNFIMKCPNGWHLNLNSQKCPDTQCCNCVSSDFDFKINYSTSDMQTGEQQALTVPAPVDGWLAGCKIEWTLSGPGTLAPTEGDNSMYTAPSGADADCANNIATITAKCMPNNVSDSITIYIHAAALAGHSAYEINIPYGANCKCPTEGGIASTNCKCDRYTISCAGDVLSHVPIATCWICKGVTCMYDSPGQCGTKLCLDGSGYQRADGTCENIKAGYSYLQIRDIRSDYDKTHGCCVDISGYN